MNTEIFDLGKIGITIGGEYDNNVIYEKLTIVLYKGKSYISTKTVQGLSPEQDIRSWQLVAEAKDAYHMLVDAGKTTLTEEEFLEQLVDATKGRYIVQGNITNAADEEDLTVEHSDLLGIDTLKLANRDNTNGMGYVILRKNKSFAEQVTKENTIYEIRYEFTLNESITIPANCVLKFDGGSINSNDNTGIITFNNTLIIGDIKCYCKPKGTIRNYQIEVDWFNNTNDIGKFLNGLKKTVFSGYKVVNFTKGKEYIVDPILLTYNDAITLDNVIFKGNWCTIKGTGTYDLGSLLYFYECTNIEVSEFNIIDVITLETKPTLGARHGISLMRGNGFHIHDIYFEEIYSDPIYFYSVDNVIIENVKAYRFGRNGISYANNKNILVRNSYFEKSITSTVATEQDAHCCINIESDVQHGTFENLRLQGCTFVDSPVSVNMQVDDMIGTVDIIIEDCTLINTQFLTNVGNSLTAASKGHIIFRNNIIRDSDSFAIGPQMNAATNITLYIEDCLLENICKRGGPSVTYDSLICAIWARDISGRTNGNIEIRNLTIRQDPNYGDRHVKSIFCNYGGTNGKINIENVRIIGCSFDSFDVAINSLYKGCSVKNGFVPLTISNFYRANNSDTYITTIESNYVADCVDGFIPFPEHVVITNKNRPSFTNLLHDSIVTNTKYVHGGRAYERADVITADRIFIDKTVVDGITKYYIRLENATVKRNENVLFTVE